MSYFNQVRVQGADTMSVDAFGRWRTSGPQGLFDTTFEYNTTTTAWEDLLNTGTVTHVPASSSVRLSNVNGTSGNYAYRQTRRYIRYQPGKSQLILMTGVLGARVANVRKRIGYFDANDGCFFEQTGTDFAVVTRTSVGGSPSDAARVVQADWNIDPMDGSGPSGITLNDALSQIFVIDLQWLGHGRVRYGFDINGVIWPVHQDNDHANTLSAPYMRTGCLPLRVEIQNTGAAALSTFLFTCAAVISEGGFETESGLDFTANNGTTAITATTRRAILSIRPAATLNSIVYRGLIQPSRLSVLTGTNDCLVEVVYNPTFTTGGGALTWTARDATQSGVEFSVHGDANAGAFTDGIVVDSFYNASGSGAARNASTAETFTRFPLVLDAAGANPRALSIVVTSMTGNSVNRASIDWSEVR